MALQYRRLQEARRAELFTGSHGATGPSSRAAVQHAVSGNAFLAEAEDWSTLNYGGRSARPYAAPAASDEAEDDGLFLQQQQHLNLRGNDKENTVDRTGARRVATFRQQQQDLFVPSGRAMMFGSSPSRPQMRGPREAAPTPTWGAASPSAVGANPIPKSKQSYRQPSPAATFTAGKPSLHSAPPQGPSDATLAAAGRRITPATEFRLKERMRNAANIITPSRNPQARLGAASPSQKSAMATTSSSATAVQMTGPGQQNVTPRVSPPRHVSFSEVAAAADISSASAAAPDVAVPASINTSTVSVPGASDDGTGRPVLVLRSEFDATSPRVNSGPCRRAPNQLTARDRILQEAADVMSARRANRVASPAFRSQTARFSSPAPRATVYDRNSYLRPRTSTTDRLHAPQGMAERLLPHTEAASTVRVVVPRAVTPARTGPRVATRVHTDAFDASSSNVSRASSGVRSRSAPRVPLGGTTPRFSHVMAHGSGLLAVSPRR
jgi:hypothetical protein